MRILYYTSGLTGSGRLVLGVSIRNALVRLGLRHEFAIAHMAEKSGFLASIENTRLPVETATSVNRENFRTSATWRLFEQYRPDVLIVDLVWTNVFHMLPELPCKKIFLTRQVAPEFFSFHHEGLELDFDPAHYDRLFAIEPYDCPVTVDRINPIVIRNPDEILPREEAVRRLRLDPAKPHCLFSLNLEEKAARETAKAYSYLEEEGYQIFYSSLMAGGLFPIADFLDAFDMVITGGGYNAFWEAVYFKKESVFIPVRTIFEDQAWRIDNCQDYEFTENGADELAEIIAGL
jgi:hypothetical protein